MKRGDIKRLLIILCVILEGINLFDKTFLFDKNVLDLRSTQQNAPQPNGFSEKVGENYDGVVFLVEDVLVMIVEVECTRLLVVVHVDMTGVIVSPRAPIIPGERPASHGCVNVYNLYFFLKINFGSIIAYKNDSNNKE